jgi:hypothetical protein
MFYEVLRNLNYFYASGPVPVPTFDKLRFASKTKHTDHPDPDAQHWFSNGFPDLAVDLDPTPTSTHIVNQEKNAIFSRQCQSTVPVHWFIFHYLFYF